MSSDDVSPTDFKRILLIPWFDRVVFRADFEAEYSSFAIYTWDDEFHWGVSTDALSSRLWQRLIAVNDIYQANFVLIDVKRTRHVSAVAKGLQTFSGGPLIAEDVDFDMWRCRMYSERPYVPFLCSFKGYQLVA